MKKFFILLLLGIVLGGCASLEKIEPYSWTENNYIAHAGGGIDEVIYTNSEEAFIENYKKGYRLFEMDFILTKDDKLVLRHDWEKIHGQDITENDLPLTYEEFMGLNYYEKYTPMDFQMLIELMEEYKDAYVIIDGKTESVEDTKNLYEKIGEETKNIEKGIFNRLIPQMFYEDDLDVIRDYGFHDIVYVVGREEYTPQSIADYCDENDIRVVSLSRSRTNEEFVKALEEKNIFVYMYTLNDTKEMSDYESIGVHGFFTDFVTPDK